jgi:hypothetical protein
VIVLSFITFIVIAILVTKEVVSGESWAVLVIVISGVVVRVTTLVYLVAIPIQGVKQKGYKFL